MAEPLSRRRAGGARASLIETEDLTGADFDRDRERSGGVTQTARRGRPRRWALDDPMAPRSARHAGCPLDRHDLADPGPARIRDTGPPQAPTVLVATVRGSRPQRVVADRRHEMGDRHRSS